MKLLRLFRHMRSNDIDHRDRGIDLLGGAVPPRPLDRATLELELEGYDFNWLRMQHSEQRTAP
jgi:hypothetical protein